MMDDLQKAYSKEVYDFIIVFKADHEHSPSLQEIAEACHMSRTNVVRYLNWLEAWGYTTRKFGIPRSIQILKRWND